MASSETAQNAEHARPNSLSLLTNGDSGPESFAVIDSSCSHDEYQMERTFTFDSIGSIDIEELVTKVQGLQTENQQLKDLMEQTHQKSDVITTRVRKLYKERTQLEDENDRLKEGEQDARTQMDMLKKELASTTDKFEKELAFSTQTCTDLRQELQLASAAADDEGESRLREENEDLRRHNEELKLELKTTKSNLDDLLKDMEKTQKIKSDIQTELLAQRETVDAQRLELAKLQRISEKIIVEKQEVIKINSRLQLELEQKQGALREFENQPITMSPTNFPELSSLSTGPTTSGFDHVTASEADGANRDAGVDEDETQVKSRCSEDVTDVTDVADTADDDGDSEYETGDEAELYAVDENDGETTAPAAVNEGDAPDLGDNEGDAPDPQDNAQAQVTEEQEVGKREDTTNDADNQSEGLTENVEENRAQEEQPVAGSSRAEASPCLPTVRIPVIARLRRDQDRTRDPLSVDYGPQTVEGLGGPVMNSMKPECYRRTVQSKLDAIGNHIRHRVSMTTEDRAIFDQVDLLIQEAREILDVEENELSAVAEENLSLKSEAESSRELVQSQETRLVDLQTEVNELRDKLASHSRLLTTVGQLKAELETAQSRLSDPLTDVRPEMMSSVESESDERQRSDSSVSGVKEEGSSSALRLEKRCMILERENATLKGIRTSHQAMSEATKEHTSMIKTENESLKKDFERISAEVVDWKMKFIRESKETTHLESMIDDLREAKDELEKEIQLLCEQLESVTDSRDQKQRELDAHRGRTDNLCEEYYKRNVSSEELLSQIAQKEVECQEYKADIRSLHTENERLNVEVNKLTDEVQLTKGQRDVFKHDYEEERTARQAIKCENDNLSLQLRGVQNELIARTSQQQYQQREPFAPGGDYRNQPHYMGGHQNQNPYPVDPAGYPQQGQGHGQGHEQPVSVGDLECPMCFERFTDVYLLQRHAATCTN